MQFLNQSFQTCSDAFTMGKIVPEPGSPVTLSLSSTLANCSMENVNSQAASCPTGWFGTAANEFCFKFHLNEVTNEESCR